MKAKANTFSTLVHFLVWAGLIVSLYGIVLFCQHESKQRADKVLDQTKQILSQMDKHAPNEFMSANESAITTTIAQTSEVQDTIQIGSLYIEILKKTAPNNLPLAAAMIRQLIKMGPPMDAKIKRIHETFLRSIENIRPTTTN